MAQQQFTTQNKKSVAAALSRLLAAEFTLYTKTLNFHWNIMGKWFGPLHKLFEDHYKSLQEMIDTIAERIRALEQPAVATMTEFLQLTPLEEEPGVYPDDTAMLKKIAHDHEMVVGLLRTITELAETNYDAGTANMSSELLETHEKMLWMIKAHLQ